MVEITVKDLDDVTAYLRKLREYRGLMKEKYLPILLRAKDLWELKKMYEDLFKQLDSKRLEIAWKRDEVKKKLSQNPELIRYAKELKIEEDKMAEEIYGLTLAFGEARRRLLAGRYR